MKAGILFTGIALVLSLPCFGQTELLVNPSFELPAVAGPCVWTTGVVATPWLGNVNDRNDSVGGFYRPTCPRVPGDTAYASKQAYGTPSAPRRIYQVVTGVTPGQSYTFTGFWSMGHQDPTGNILCKAELYDGADFSAPLIASYSLTQGQGWQDWLPFGVSGAPTGTTITALVSAYNTGSTAWCLHLDGCSLKVTTCTTPPTIETITPDHCVRGSTADLTITGTGFAADQTSVTLARPGQQNVTATDVVVASDGKSLTCKLNLTADVANGPWNVFVTVTGQGCMPAIRLDGVLVVLPALSNPSFELPTAAGACPAVPLTDRPTDWLVAPIANYGDTILLRDSDQFPPTCPPPDGVHYGSSTSIANAGAGAQATIYQTISVTPGSEYTFSGLFAGGGLNTTSIELYDGDQAGALLSSAFIKQLGLEAYDWTPAFVIGTPTKDYMTVLWRIKLDGAAPHAAHADKLALDVCSTGGVHPRIHTLSPLPAGTCGQAYTLQLLACALGNETWSVVGGKLPWGLTLDSTGLLSGVPISGGTAQFTVQLVDDYDGAAVTKTFELTASGSTCCSNPPADLDGDNDVDQADFAVFQACFTGVAGGVGAGCSCADLNSDGLAVDQTDMEIFELCAGSPGVPAACQ